MRAMSWSRSSSYARAAGAVGLGLGVAAAVACSSAEKLAGEGGACSLVTDCQDGLVCVPENPSQPSGSRVCSNNPSAFVPADTGTPEPDAGGIPTMLPDPDAEPVPDALAASSDGAGPQDATMTTMPEEAAPPPPAEASSPPPEASTPPVEASTPEEASAPVSDAAAHD
jgi:hypothetical protein